MTIADRIEHALAFQTGQVRQQVFNPQIRPHWIGKGDRFWYRRETPGGVEFVTVDAATGARAPAFDTAALAAALRAQGVAADAARLALQQLEIDEAGAMRFRASGKGFSWQDGLLRPLANGPAPGQLASPDASRVVFRRGDDLWLRAEGAERALTTDGVRHLSYAKSPDMNLTTVTLRRRGVVAPPLALWSPDGTRLFTHRLDEREVRDWPLVQHVPDDGSPRPVAHVLKIAQPGDEHLPMQTPVVIDIATGQRVEAPASVAGVMTCIEKQEAWWSADSQRVFWIDRDRFSRRITLREMEAGSGAVRNVLTEEAPTFIDVNLSVSGLPNIRVLDATEEVVWFSQRDGFAHLYLHDLRSGALKNRITSGDWVVRDIVQVDASRRQVWFLAAGVDPGWNPYWRVLCRAGLDGSGFTLLTSESGEHCVAMPAFRAPRDLIKPEGEVGEAISPSGDYFVHTHGALDRLPESVLRRRDGSKVAVLERAAMAPELARKWRWPVTFAAKAADGETDLFGALWLPTDFDPSRRYPVIDNIYPGPQRGQTPSQYFSEAPGELGRALLPQMFAELGCVVLNVDGRGTPLRGKAFHDFSYGHLDNPGCLEDHIAVLRQLAARHDWLDLSRVGIMGHSGGGYASVRALLEYPDVFHAAVATSGNHDNRGYSFSWTEKYMGPLRRDGQGRSNYDSAANPPYAGKLQGKLLLAWGDMDDNVHPGLTIQLVDALIKAGKDFDMLVLPNEDHTSVWNNQWFLRRAMRFMAEALRMA